MCFKMKTALETLKEMLDIAVALEPNNREITIHNDGEHVIVTRIVKKLNSADLTKEEIVQVMTDKASEYPEFDFSYLENGEFKNN